MISASIALVAPYIINESIQTKSYSEDITLDKSQRHEFACSNQVEIAL